MRSTGLEPVNLSGCTFSKRVRLPVSPRAHVPLLDEVALRKSLREERTRQAKSNLHKKRRAALVARTELP